MLCIYDPILCWTHRAWLVWRRAIVILVGTLILSVPVLGIAYVLPSLYHGVLLGMHMAVTAVLTVNTFFNFIAAACRHPGQG